MSHRIGKFFSHKPRHLRRTICRSGLTRPEISPNNRAICKDTVCKKEKSKLLKGDIRFGSWVEVSDYPGSWAWKHWGCVSGAQILNLRQSLAAGGEDYNWDLLDGYDELNDHPDLQEKVRRAIIDGHIAPEDFNGVSFLPFFFAGGGLLWSLAC
ncbi:poly polymerase and DNA-ligase Zn-finger region-domain-containing protein [Immersiella caudata]|uniref:Poly polymerase and DNA-ligase Zn-finger region-domain-containing protein n=1 Tax=Immersiella caudata TaxID=314043 RepID=A0AA40CBW5_9PEZI|nr:poly polymerase and DNA-ligase Zn-finger region-domain-containing protein [Immersiella caudata]